MAACSFPSTGEFEKLGSGFIFSARSLQVLFWKPHRLSLVLVDESNPIPKREPRYMSAWLRITLRTAHDRRSPSHHYNRACNAQFDQKLIKVRLTRKNELIWLCPRRTNLKTMDQSTVVQNDHFSLDLIECYHTFKRAVIFVEILIVV